MPSALLEQSRNVLRTRFNAILKKRVYTLTFDRSCEDLETVAALYEKLQVCGFIVWSVCLCVCVVSVDLRFAV